MIDMSKVCELSNLIVVENSYTAKVKGADKKIGYKVKNMGESDITYTDKVWEIDANGNHILKDVDRVLKSGDTVDFNRVGMTAFCSMSEISFQLANGIMKKGNCNKALSGVISELASYYFKAKNEIPDVMVTDNEGNIKEEFKEIFEVSMR